MNVKSLIFKEAFLAAINAFSTFDGIRIESIVNASVRVAREASENTEVIKHYENLKTEGEIP